MNKKRKSPNQKQRIAAIVIVAALACVIPFLQPLLGQYGINLYELFGITQPVAAAPAQGTAEVHFIDVGQASSILIKGSEKTALIDAGENATSADVVQYLQAQGVVEIDYFFNTHPHSDHVGGSRSIMQEVPTRQFIMPQLAAKAVPTTVTYQKLLEYLGSNKDSTTTQQLAPGEQPQYDLGGGLMLTVTGPVESYDDLNDTSLVIRMDFGKTSFLFTGDMEETSQKDMLGAGRVAPVTVLSAPHHGSRSSIYGGFIKATAPQYAVISCGKDNDYGHPHAETLALYHTMGITTYRTDERGAVKMVTDGSNIMIETQR